MSEKVIEMDTGSLVDIIEAQIIDPDANENTHFLAAAMMRKLDFTYESEGRFVPPSDLSERDLSGMEFLDELSMVLDDEKFDAAVIANKTAPDSVLLAFEEKYTDTPSGKNILRQIGANPSYPLSHAIDVIRESDNQDLFIGVLSSGKVSKNEIYHALSDAADRFGKDSESVRELKLLLKDARLDAENYNPAKYIGAPRDDQHLLPGLGEYIFDHHHEVGLERAKKGLLRILKRESVLLEDVAKKVYDSREYVPDEIRRNDFYIRADAPEVVQESLGDSNQIVFRVAEGWVAKAKKGTWKEGEYYGISGFLSYSTKNVGVDDTLAEIGIKEVPRHHYFGFADGANNFEFDHEMPPCIVLTKDITEGGKYELHEVDGFDFSTVSNGKELQAEYQRTKSLLNNYANGKVASMKLYADRHGGQGGTGRAIDRTFFCAVDPVSNVGKIVPGDLDNIIFEKR